MRPRRSRSPIATPCPREFRACARLSATGTSRATTSISTPTREAIVTIGSKEGIAHLCLAILDSRDTVLVPNPSYPIHIYGPVIAGAHVVSVPVHDCDQFLAELESIIPRMTPRPKALIVNFPSNPTTQCVDLPFLARLVELAREYGFHLIHDLAYADLGFDGYKPPSVLQVPGAKDVAVEFFTLSKSYNMPGWRVGFMVGNPVLVNALARLKSYFDYGTFTPIQVASILALEGPQDCVTEIRENYRRRRDVLIEGLNRAGWVVPSPKATMFVWAKIPEAYRPSAPWSFSKLLLTEAKVAVSPGIGFGDYGDGHVRFSLIENEERTRQAIRGIKQMLAKSAHGRMIRDGKCVRTSEVGRRRKEVYWALSGVSPFVFVLFVFMLMMVPGEEDATKLWLLSIAGIMLTVSLALGIWRPQTSEAPITAGLSGLVIAIILGLQLVQCLLGIGYLLKRMLW